MGRNAQTIVVPGFGEMPAKRAEEFKSGDGFFLDSRHGPLIAEVTGVTRSGGRILLQYRYVWPPVPARVSAPDVLKARPKMYLVWVRPSLVRRLRALSKAFTSK